MISKFCDNCVLKNNLCEKKLKIKYTLTITTTMSATQSPLTAKNFDVSKLTLEKPIQNKERKNVYSAKLKYDGESFLLQTPKLFTPFGASSYNDDDKYVLSFTLGDESKEGKYKELMNSVEEKVRELVGALPKKFSGKNFTKLVKPAKDPKYKPTFSVKLKSNQETGELFASVFNKKKEALNVTLETIKSELPKHSEVRCILMLNTVWFVNANCGITVNAKQLIVYPSKEQGCMFNELSDDESEEEDQPGAEAEVAEAVDDEESDIDSDEE